MEKGRDQLKQPNWISGDKVLLSPSSAACNVLRSSILLFLISFQFPVPSWMYTKKNKRTVSLMIAEAADKSLLLKLNCVWKGKSFDRLFFVHLLPQESLPNCNPSIDNEKVSKSNECILRKKWT